MTRDTNSIFNAAIASSAIAAAFELGLFDELRRRGRVRVGEYCDRHDLHRDSLEAVLSALHCCRIVELDQARDEVETGDLFDQAHADKGYFSWLSSGYGRMLQNLGALVRNENRRGEFSGRSGEHIARAGRDYGAHFVDPHFDAMLDELPFEVAADIGCGSADRLINLARRRPGFRGVGIEMNAGAAALARNSISDNGCNESLTVLEGDLRSVEAAPVCDDVELVFSFFMGHDLWPRESCLEALERIRELFPRARRFLLCDTYRSNALGNGEVPIFTLGFELTHAVMGQYVPTVEEWLNLFEESGWRCVNRRQIDIPYSCIFDLRS
jgi:hypothetical protein